MFPGALEQVKAAHMPGGGGWGTAMVKLKGSEDMGGLNNGMNALLIHL